MSLGDVPPEVPQATPPPAQTPDYAVIFLTPIHDHAQLTRLLYAIVGAFIDQTDPVKYPEFTMDDNPADLTIHFQWLLSAAERLTLGNLVKAFTSAWASPPATATLYSVTAPNPVTNVSSRIKLVYAFLGAYIADSGASTIPYFWVNYGVSSITIQTAWNPSATLKAAFAKVVARFAN